MRLPALVVAACVLGSLSLSAQGHVFTQKFNSMHYSVNEVILGPGETLDAARKSRIEEEEAAHARGLKYQTVTAVFPAGARGLAGTINQPLEGLLTVMNYGGKKPEVSWRTENVSATDVGIPLNRDLLRTLVDNRIISKVLTEFAGMPVIFSNLELELNRVDFRGTRYYTFKDRSYVIDTAIIDSLYYTRDQRSRVVPGCKVSVMAMVDHVLPDAPLFVTARGAVNTISCPAGK